MPDISPTGPACGNNPNYPLTDGDRQAVAEFRAYLAEREQAATAEAEAALAPLEAKARALREQQRARHRAEVLREAADIAESTVALFEDSDEGAAAAGAMEGLAIRFRRMADEAQP